MKQKSNKKIVLHFVLIMLACLVFGGCIGYGIGYASDGLSDLLTYAGNLLVQNAIWLMLASFILLAVSYFFYRKGKRLAATLHDDDEAGYEAADCAYSLAFNAVTVFIVFLFTFLGLGFSAGQASFSRSKSLMFIGLLAIGLVLAFVLQGVLIQATKRLYPEKRGNILDAKFQKDWFASCDEAERQMIGQAAYTSMQATAGAFMVASLVCIFLAFILPIGPLPILLVGALWLVQQESYLLAAAKLGLKNNTKREEH